MTERCVVGCMTIVTQQGLLHIFAMAFELLLLFFKFIQKIPWDLLVQEKFLVDSEERTHSRLNMLGQGNDRTVECRRGLEY